MDPLPVAVEPPSQDTRRSELEAVVAAFRRTHAFAEYDARGIVRSTDARFARALGYRPEELVDEHVSLFWRGDDGDTAEQRAAWRTLVGDGEVPPAMSRRQRADRSTAWFDSEWVTVRDEHGAPLKVLEFARDVTEQKALEDQTRQLKMMMDASPVAVMFAGRDHVIRMMNPASMRLLESIAQELPCRPDEVVGRSMHIFHKQPEKARGVVDDKAKLPHQARIRLGGEHISLKVDPIFDAAHEFTGVMLTWDVITDRVQSEERQKELTSRLQETLEGVTSNAGEVNEASTALEKTADQMRTNSEETTNQANVAAAAAEEISVNIATLASSAEEMSSTAKEIARHADDALRVANEAVTVADDTSTTVHKLGESSNEVGNVIKVITSIAQQTNLLALNATIEAARAGEAGKGFAVVASEVKELAKQTAAATEEISAKIEAIQSDTQGAVSAIGQIGAIIKQISELQGSIANAVAEQTDTTNEIARNVNEAATGSTEIARNIVSVSAAAQSTHEGANETAASAARLSSLASALEAMVDRPTKSDER